MKSVAKRRAADKKPTPKDVENELKSAADARVEALKVLNEVVALRKLADAVELAFQNEGIGNPSPNDILREAIRCAKDDFELIGDASESGLGAPEGMVFQRAQLRLDLALTLADYRERFGRDGKAVAS